MPGVRVTKVEKERRILKVREWIIESRTDVWIISKIKGDWGLSRRMAQNYLTNAYTEFKQDQDIIIENKRAAKIAELKEALRKLDTQFKRTPSGLNAIARIQKLIIRLEGIEPPQQHQVEANVNTVIKPTKYVDATRNRDSSSTTSD